VLHVLKVDPEKILSDANAGSRHQLTLSHLPLLFHLKPAKSEIGITVQQLT
jgi:hypothetical protein